MSRKNRIHQTLQTQQQKESAVTTETKAVETVQETPAEDQTLTETQGSPEPEVKQEQPAETAPGATEGEGEEVKDDTPSEEDKELTNSNAAPDQHIGDQPKEGVVDSVTRVGESLVVNVVEAPVAAPAAGAYPAPIPVPQDPKQLPLSASTAARMVIAELNDYVEKMSGRSRLSPEEGGQAQALLYATLMQAVNHPAEEFELVFSRVIAIIRENLNGCFSAANVHRYTPYVVMPAVNATHMRFLVGALVDLAEPRTREVVRRQVNINQTFGNRRISEEARQRVLAYFNFDQ